MLKIKTEIKTCTNFGCRRGFIVERVPCPVCTGTGRIIIFSPTPWQRFLTRLGALFC